MKIAVIGSWRDSDRQTWNLEYKAGFQQAAAALGEKIVELGHSLIVGSDRQDTADYHATLGAVKAIGSRASKPRIHVLAPRGYRSAFASLERDFPGAIAQDDIEADDWGPAKVFQVKQADRVLILGGAEKTLQAGLTAVVSERRLVCVGSFGGAAKKLNRYLTNSRASWGQSIPVAGDLGLLQRPWSDFLLNKIPELLRFQNKPTILIIHGRSEDREELKSYLQNDRKLPEPTIMAEKLNAGEVLPVKFEQLASSVDGAIALGTPDDIGYLSDPTDFGFEKQLRARQNVWLEVGWFWGRLGRGHVLILTRGELSIPSDLFGIESYRYEHRPSECSREIEAFLQRVCQGDAI